MQPSPPASDRLFNNADSFAYVFDQAWSQLSSGHASGNGGSEALLEAVLVQLADHPFALADPAMARQVGEFRIRLLGL
jgi:ABC-type phosphate/phosphonate transport system ATPase subunit